MDRSEVRIARPADRTAGEPTAGMLPEQAIVTDGVWPGLVHTESGMVSGGHHHGEYESTIYVLAGAMRMEFGPAGERQLDAGPGDFLYVPPFVVHREGNPSGDRGTAVPFGPAAGRRWSMSTGRDG